MDNFTFFPLMRSMSYNDTTASPNLIPRSILRNNILGIKFRIEIHIGYNLYRIICVQDPNVIFGSFQHNAYLIFRSFYQVVFF